VKAQPDNAAYRFNLGLAAAAAGDTNKAEINWREAVRLNPRMMTAQHALANVAANKRDANQLGQIGEQLVVQAPHASEGYVYLAGAAGIRGDQATAEAELKRAISVAPQNPLGYAKLGQLKLAQKNNSEAEKLFTEALQRDPSYADALDGIVTLYESQQRPERAFDVVKRAVAANPGNAHAQLLLGAAAASVRDFSTAEAAARKMIELSPRDADGYSLLSQIQSLTGKTDEAVATYKHWADVLPRDARPWFLMASVEQSKGNTNSAKQLYRKALDQQADFPAAANNLAYLMLESGDNVDVALSLAQSARQRMPELTVFTDTLGWAYYKKGLYSMATSLFEQAVKKDPSNATYHYHLGLAYQMNKDSTKARTELHEVLRINPNFADATAVKQALAAMGT
jgi:tetratricopeptide (TPR) repeat protein